MRIDRYAVVHRSLLSSTAFLFIIYAHQTHPRSFIIIQTCTGFPRGPSTFPTVIGFVGPLRGLPPARRVFSLRTLSAAHKDIIHQTYVLLFFPSDFQTHTFCTTTHDSHTHVIKSYFALDVHGVLSFFSRRRFSRPADSAGPCRPCASCTPRSCPVETDPPCGRTTRFSVNAARAVRSSFAFRIRPKNRSRFDPQTYEPVNVVFTTILMLRPEDRTTRRGLGLLSKRSLGEKTRLKTLCESPSTNELSRSVRSWKYPTSR